jgi:hypothetical protein
LAEHTKICEKWYGIRLEHKSYKSIYIMNIWGYIHRKPILCLTNVFSRHQNTFREFNKEFLFAIFT